LGGAIDLYRQWLELMKLLGAPYILIEVDAINPRVEKMHLLMGATRLKEFHTADGRQRAVLKYNFLIDR